MGVSRRSYFARLSRLRQGKAWQLFVVGLLVHVTHRSVIAAAWEFETAVDSDPFRNDPTTSVRGVSEQTGSKVQILKDESVLNFTLSDGDEVGCVPIESQPSLNVGNFTTKFQLRPSSEVKRGNSTTSSRGAHRAQQTFNVEVGSCPDGSIPVRRSRDIFNLTSIFFETQSAEEDNEQLQSTLRTNIHRRRKNGPPSFSQQSGGNGSGDGILSAHEHAYVYANDTRAGSDIIKGMEVILNIWEPYVEDPEEFSLAQFWLISGSYNGNLSTTVNNYSTILNTIEAGWQVFEGLYGDNRSRLFLFWTADAYNDTGCYNLHCTGFVQTSNKVLVGGSFTPTSRLNSTQYEIELLVFMDHSSGNWWLVLNEEPVGYWPSHLFTGKLQDSAEVVEFGGEIIDSESADHSRHTRTNMGSGYYPQAGHKVAAYQRNLQIVDKDNHLRDAQIRLGRAQAPACYNALITTDFQDWGSHFFYGGGRGYPMCHEQVPH